MQSCATRCNQVQPGATRCIQVQSGAPGAQGAAGSAGSTGIPAGLIAIWSGAANAIPTGWALCDGSSGRPDLRSKFVLGAGSSYSVGAQGGYTDTPIINHNHTYGTSTNDNGAHQHTEDAHRPYYDSEDGGISGWAVSSENSVTQSNRNIGNSTGAHAHDFNGTTDGASNSISSGSGRNMPPYYALCYIMKT